MATRPYANDRRKQGIKAFVGAEVEKTPAFGKTTLFLVGLLKPEDVRVAVEKAQQELLESLPHLPKLDHIFYGANWSFDGQSMDLWTAFIEEGLREGFWCTLDLRPAHIPLLQMSGLCKHSKFVPLIGVRLPKVASLGINATLKIDDISFAGTNSGVWCHHLPQLITQEKSQSFTPWTAYKQDHVLNIEDFT